MRNASGRHEAIVALVMFLQVLGMVETWEVLGNRLTMIKIKNKQ